MAAAAVALAPAAVALAPAVVALAPAAAAASQDGVAQSQNRRNGDYAEELEHYTKALEYCKKNKFDDVEGLEGFEGVPKSLYSLLIKIFGTPRKTGNPPPIQDFNMDVSIKDEFVQNTNIEGPDHFVNWYERKNPGFKAGEGFKTVEELEQAGTPILMPEFTTLLAQIARDCFIMIFTGQKNLNNNLRKKQSLTVSLYLHKELKKNTPNIQKRSSYTWNHNHNNLEKIKNKKTKKNVKKKLLKHFTNPINNTLRSIFEGLLDKIDACIKLKYKYCDALKIVFDFINALSTDEPFPYTYTDFMPLVHLVYPTYQALTYQQVVLLTTCPIANVMITNRKRFIHGQLDTSKINILHDLGHARFSHNMFILNPIPKTTLIAFFKINQFINDKLFTHYYNVNQQPNKKTTANNNRVKKKYDTLSPEQKKLVFALFLFNYLHEAISDPLGKAMQQLLKNTRYKSNIIIDIEQTALENYFYSSYNLKIDWESVIDAFFQIAVANDGTFIQKLVELETEFQKLVELETEYNDSNN